MAAADQLVERLDEAIAKLADYPALGPERPSLGPDIRILPVDNLTIYYRIASGQVEIVRILHAARDVTPDLLSD